MSDPFIAEIRIVGFNFPPRGWARCDGQLLPIDQNTALFSLVGTIYGGNGRTDFGLPDLRGRAPMHFGNGPGLTPRSIGQKSGAPTVTLNTSTVPTHRHTARAANAENDQGSPIGNVWGTDEMGDAYSNSPNVSMDGGILTSTGGGAAHTNQQPFLGLYFVIALVGIYPPRS